MMMKQWPPTILQLAAQVTQPAKDSHKGQNGKLLIVGGSELFHAASKWSLDIASKLVDMVFYASVPSNNELVQKAKGEFWNGIVIEIDNIESYAEEADCILIGPGMTRSDETKEIVEKLVKAFPHKKMVIDAGALQMISPELLNEHHIVTPHKQELLMVYEKVVGKSEAETAEITEDLLLEISKKCGGVMILLKGMQDFLVQYREGSGNSLSSVVEVINGGHPGMTKGGTGDVLAGLVAALYCTNEALVAAIIASAVCKRAGETLAEKVGPYFNASDLVAAIPEQLWEVISSSHSLQQ